MPPEWEEREVNDAFWVHLGMPHFHVPSENVAIIPGEAPISTNLGGVLFLWKGKMMRVSSTLSIQTHAKPFPPTVLNQSQGPGFIAHLVNH